MPLGETLLPWNSRDKKCCLYKMLYVAAPIWVLGDVITKFYALHATSYRRTYKSQNCFGSQVTRFWRDTSCHIKTPTRNFQEEIYKRKWYRKGLLITLLEESHEEYLQAQEYLKCLCKQTLLWLIVMRKEPQEPWRTRRPQDRDVEQSAPTHASHTHCTPRQLGTTVDWRYDVPRSPAKSTFKRLYKQTPLWLVVMRKEPQEPWRTQRPQNRSCKSHPLHS